MTARRLQIRAGLLALVAAIAMGVFVVVPTGAATGEPVTEPPVAADFVEPTAVLTRPGYEWCTGHDERTIAVWVTDQGGDGPAPLMMGSQMWVSPAAIVVKVESRCGVLPVTPDVRRDFGARVQDLDYVYQLLCVGDPPAGIEGVDLTRIDCSRVMVNGNSAGGITGLLLLDECWSHLPLAQEVDVIVTGMATFTPVVEPGDGLPGWCPVGSPYVFTHPVVLAMEASCDDPLFPIGNLAPWWSAGSPKFLWEQTGGHVSPDATAQAMGQAVADYYLVGDPAARATLVGLTSDPDMLYSAPWGARLRGGVCGIEPAFTG